MAGTIIIFISKKDWEIWLMIKVNTVLWGLQIGLGLGLHISVPIHTYI